MKIQICLSADSAYAQHLGVTITSILKNAKKSDELFFYILDGGLSEIDKSRILGLNKFKNFTIEFIPINKEDFINCPLVGNHITIATYYRFMIPTLLPDLDKVLYLDCDMVIEDTLSELFAENIDGYWLAGVEDLGYYRHRRILGRETESFYVNAGLLLINLNKWREDNIEEKLFKFAEENKDILVHQDQDVINMVLNKKSKPLAYKWNVQDSFYRAPDRNIHPNAKLFKVAARNPSIVHYTGCIKPWNEYFFLPGAIRYLKYLKYTPWKGELPSDISVYGLAFKSIVKYFIHRPFFFISKHFWSLNSRLKKRELLKYVS